MSAPSRRRTREASSRRPGIAVTLAWVFLAAFSPVAADSKCGTGNAPTYNDVDAITFTQNGCGSTIQDANVAMLKSSQFPHGWFVSTFDCSTFWVFFWNNGRENVPTKYSQYNLKDAVGTFDLSATLDDARALLRKAHFYDLNPNNLTITDTARTVLSVKRCAVITRISVFNSSTVTQDGPTLRLFDEFRVLVAGATRNRLSSAPSDFEQTRLFDP
ncbi:MAG: hypothetical protein WB810_06920 [Candidatus Cybelea sp.]